MRAHGSSQKPFSPNVAAVIDHGVLAGKEWDEPRAYRLSLAASLSPGTSEVLTLATTFEVDEGYGAAPRVFTLSQSLVNADGDDEALVVEGTGLNVVVRAYTTPEAASANGRKLVTASAAIAELAR